MTKTYKTKEEIRKKAGTIINKSLREVLSKKDIQHLEKEVGEYEMRRKGFLGEIVEKYFFEINPGNTSEPDFKEAGVELKTTPIRKHLKKKFVSKERLVFSMINYDEVINETWETSSFLKKNTSLLLVFYLWVKEQIILDYEFKFAHFLDLLGDLSDEDVYQIKKDWEYIVSKIRRGEAHLLSEGDTYYLGAVTKAANSRVVRDQPKARVPAKPRAFSLKQQYLNYLIQKELLGRNVNTDSIFSKKRRIETIEDAVKDKFAKYLGKTDTQIRKILGFKLNGKKPKAYKRMLANRILGVKSNRIEELKKANVTLRVITLEHTGTLRESISFPSFDYKDIVNQVWYDEEKEKMSDFHEQLEARKFLFVVFQKIKGSDEVILKNVKFWNFPMKDLPEAEKVWNKAVKAIEEGKYDDLPKISESNVVHVRPHARNADDTLETPQGGQEVKRCFWLNAKYIQNIVSE